MSDDCYTIHPSSWALSLATHHARPRNPDSNREARGSFSSGKHGERMTDISPEERRLFASVDSAFIGQNVYLFWVSEDLVTVFRRAADYPKLNRTLKLPDQQFVTFAQTVGYARA